MWLETVKKGWSMNKRMIWVLGLLLVAAIPVTLGAKVAVHASLLDIKVETQSTPEFVIVPKQKKQSSSVLKETIGKTTKQAFECTTNMGQYVGNVQNSLSDAQQKVVQQKTIEQEQLKNMLNVSSLCNRTLGGIQHELAQMQKKCTTIVEKLIDNEPPFKKASKATLSKTLDVLTCSCQQLQTSCVVLQTVSSEIKKIDGKSSQQLQAIVSKLQHQEQALHKTYSVLSTDECLKTL
jgi:hypothetical protein